MRLYAIIACLLATLTLRQMPDAYANVRASEQDNTSPTAIAANPDRSSAQEERWMQQVIVLTNQERAKHGLPPLKRQKLLTDAARWFARDMGDHSYLDHTDTQGRRITPRIPEFGYTDFETIGENIAAGQKTPEEVLKSWMTSEGHKANILNPKFREIGVGYAMSQRDHYRHYWVQDFGSRFDIYPVVVNNEAGQTSDVSVSLYLYGAGIMKQMRFSNDGKTWSVWETFRSKRDWTLEPGKGKRTVFVELKNGDHTYASNDDIELVAPPKPTALPERSTKKKRPTSIAKS